MSQYPLDNNSDIVEAVNYLLSGPTSIGQNFEGMSAVGINVLTDSVVGQTRTYLTGMPIPGPSAANTENVPGARYEQPGSVDLENSGTYDISYPLWNTLPGGLPITDIVPVSATGREITVTVDLYSTGILYVTGRPFVYGQQVVLSGITPSSFNGTYTVKNSFVDAEVVLVQDVAETWGTYTSGGVVKINDIPGAETVYGFQRFFTGNQAIVTVTGPTDRVFISSQIDNIGLYTYTDVDQTVVQSVAVSIEINRYRAVQKTTLPDVGSAGIYAVAGSAYQGYLWEFDENVIQVPYNVTFTVDSATEIDFTELGNIIINNIIDSPGIGTYLYAFQICGDVIRDTVIPDTRLILGIEQIAIRSFTAQAIKR
jgi:hypothetical protein